MRVIRHDRFRWACRFRHPGLAVAVVLMAVVVGGCGSAGATQLGGGDAKGGLCAHVTDPAAVVRIACRKIPALSDPGTSMMKATTLLREWVAGWVDYPLSESLEMSATANWHESVDTLYRRFEADEKGVFCGGTATTLMKVYRAFGLDSWTYNFGVAKGSLTHVVTLVRADGKIIVQDAYADYTLTDGRGRPLDIRAILSLLHRGRAAAIRRSGAASARDILMTPSRYAQVSVSKGLSWPYGSASNLSHCSRVRPDVERCRATGVDFARLREAGGWWTGIEKLLAAKRPGRSFLYLMTFPISVASIDDGGFAWPHPVSDSDSPTNDLVRDLRAALGEE